MSMELDIPEVIEEVRAAFEEYENALVNNDVAVLDRLFWEDVRVVRYGAGENLYGYDQIQAFRAARPGNNLARTLHNTCITTHGRDLATVWTEFTRPGNPRTGRQSQVWARRPEGWRVVAAHVSFMDEG